MPTQDVSIARHFTDLTYPRVERSRKYSLGDILAIGRCAVNAGADSWDEVEGFCRGRHAWLRTFLAPPNGIPSHDTFYRVFARLDPQRFGECAAGRGRGRSSGTGIRSTARPGW